MAPLPGYLLPTARPRSHARPGSVLEILGALGPSASADATAPARREVGRPHRRAAPSTGRRRSAVVAARRVEACDAG